MTKVKVELNYDVPVNKLSEFGKLINQIDELLDDKPKTKPPTKLKGKNGVWSGWTSEKIVFDKPNKSNKKPLTKASAALDSYINEYKKKWSIEPTVSQISKRFNIAKASASKRLSRLRQEKK